MLLKNKPLLIFYYCLPFVLVFAQSNLVDKQKIADIIREATLHERTEIRENH
jgi:hypothetical protein